MKQIIVWDFDGVINDSFVQRAVIASLVYETYRQNSVDHPMLTLERINPDHPLNRKVIGALRPVRPFLLPEDGGKRNYLEQLILLLDKGENFTNRDEFRILRDKYPEVATIGQKYADLYKKLDSAMEEQFPDMWIKLNPLYEGVREQFLALKEEFLSYILSVKDKDVILKVLNYNGLDFKNENVLYADKNLEKDGKKPKVVRLEEISDRTGIPFKKIHFIDDEVGQVEVVKSQLPEINVYWASWGYAPKGIDAQKIISQGIHVVYRKSFSDAIREQSQKDK